MRHPGWWDRRKSLHVLSIGPYAKRPERGLVWSSELSTGGHTLQILLSRGRGKRGPTLGHRAWKIATPSFEAGRGWPRAEGMPCSACKCLQVLARYYVVTTYLGCSRGDSGERESKCRHFSKRSCEISGLQRPDPFAPHRVAGAEKVTVFNACGVCASSVDL